MRDLAPCIICGKELESVNPSAKWLEQPVHATSFASGGHYGSGVFDSMSRDYIQINICDEDLMAAAKAGRVLLATPSRVETPPPTYEVFEPYEPSAEELALADDHVAAAHQQLREHPEQFSSASDLP